jgi:hypothetical protein
LIFHYIWLDESWMRLAHTEQWGNFSVDLLFFISTQQILERGAVTEIPNLHGSIRASRNHSTLGWIEGCSCKFVSLTVSISKFCQLTPVFNIPNCNETIVWTRNYILKLIIV